MKLGSKVFHSKRFPPIPFLVVSISRVLKFFPVKRESPAAYLRETLVSSPARKQTHNCSACGAVLLRIEKFREPGIFLEEGEIFVVARVVAIFPAKFDGHLEIR